MGFLIRLYLFIKQKGILASKDSEEKEESLSKGTMRFCEWPVKVEVVVWKLIRPLALSHLHSELFGLFSNLELMVFIRKSDHKESKWIISSYVPETSFALWDMITGRWKQSNPAGKVFSIALVSVRWGLLEGSDLNKKRNFLKDRIFLIPVPRLIWNLLVVQASLKLVVLKSPHAEIIGICHHRKFLNNDRQPWQKAIALAPCC